MLIANKLLNGNILVSGNGGQASNSLPPSPVKLSLEGGTVTAYEGKTALQGFAFDDGWELQVNGEALDPQPADAGELMDALAESFFFSPLVRRTFAIPSRRTRFYATDAAHVLLFEAANALPADAGDPEGPVSSPVPWSSGVMRYVGGGAIEVLTDLSAGGIALVTLDTAVEAGGSVMMDVWNVIDRDGEIIKLQSRENVFDKAVPVKASSEGAALPPLKKGDLIYTYIKPRALTGSPPEVVLDYFPSDGPLASDRSETFAAFASYNFV